MRILAITTGSLSVLVLSSGDLEKEKLQLTPIQMMDRDYKDKLPAMQVEFIDTICLPVYTNLVKLSDNLQPMLHGKLIPPNIDLS